MSTKSNFRTRIVYELAIPCGLHNPNIWMLPCNYFNTIIIITSSNADHSDRAVQGMK
jgi:hypothetical protein